MLTTYAFLHKQLDMQYMLNKLQVDAQRVGFALNIDKYVNWNKQHSASTTE